MVHRVTLIYQNSVHEMTQTLAHSCRPIHYIVTPDSKFIVQFKFMHVYGANTSVMTMNTMKPSSYD